VIIMMSESDDAPASPPLGGLAVADFMRKHWQRRPLLIRQAIPGVRSPVTPHGLRALAARDDVESRVVSAFGGRWRMRRGPFESGDLPSPHKRGWTLLVQGVDLHVDAAHALLQRFRFIGDARLDDLMISWASDCGGVGPHSDSYDVFLLQVQGHRRWRIAPPTRGDAALVANLPLRILADFHPTDEWTLDPGDMLYLPPGWAHEGVAIGECMTCSVGFRAPSRHEFLSALLIDSAEAPGGADPRHTDPGRSPTRAPGRVPESLAGRLEGWAAGWRPRSTATRRFIGRWLTEPKPQVWFDPPTRPLSRNSFARRASREGLRADRRTRIAYRGRDLFINGECFPLTADVALRHLADSRRLPARLAAMALLQARTGELLHRWWASGWLQLGVTAEPTDESAFSVINSTT
jgi:50S ribosomal protein L16 3-hydroxylase